MGAQLYTYVGYFSNLRNIMGGLTQSDANNGGGFLCAMLLRRGTGSEQFSQGCSWWGLEI
jgi:hypothetical protein